MFMWILTAKARAKSVTRLFLDLGPRHFLCRFSHDVALVTCPCAFRLCRLAQSAWLALAGLHFPRQAQEFFRTSLHDLAWILMRWSCGDPFNSSLRGPCMILYRGPSQKILRERWKVIGNTGCCERKKNMKPSIVSRLYIPKFSLF